MHRQLVKNAESRWPADWYLVNSTGPPDGQCGPAHTSMESLTALKVNEAKFERNLWVSSTVRVWLLLLHPSWFPSHFVLSQHTQVKGQNSSSQLRFVSTLGSILIIDYTDQFFVFAAMQKADIKTQYLLSCSRTFPQRCCSCYIAMDWFKIN